MIVHMKNLGMCGWSISWLDPTIQKTSKLKNYISPYTTKKTKLSEGYLVRENMKSLSNSVTKFCDQGICEEFHFFRH